MLLKNLSIGPKNTWSKPGPDNPYVATVHYTTDSQADITMPLGAEVAQRLLEIVADELVKASKEVASKLTHEIITHSAVAAIAAPQRALVTDEDDIPL